jgi:ribosomal protein L19E
MYQPGTQDGRCDRMDTTGLCMNMMRALTRIWREENDAAEIERALYSLKYGEIYKEERYGDL